MLKAPCSYLHRRSNGPCWKGFAAAKNRSPELACCILHSKISYIVLLRNIVRSNVQIHGLRESAVASETHYFESVSKQDRQAGDARGMSWDKRTKGRGSRRASPGVAGDNKVNDRLATSWGTVLLHSNCCCSYIVSYCIQVDKSWERRPAS